MPDPPEPHVNEVINISGEIRGEPGGASNGNNGNGSSGNSGGRNGGRAQNSRANPGGRPIISRGGVGPSPPGLPKPGVSLVSKQAVQHIDNVLTSNSSNTNPDNPILTKDQKAEVIRQLDDAKTNAAGQNRRADVDYYNDVIDWINGDNPDE